MLLAALLAWALVCGCRAHTASPDVATSAPYDERQHQRETAPSSLLWRARMGASTVFFLGSVHVARPSAYPLPEPVEQAFQSSSHLVLEVALKESEQAEMAGHMLRAGLLEPGQKLADLVGDETLRLLEKTLQERGRSLDGALRFQPWFLAVTLTTTELEEAGFLSELGVDQYFQERAVQRNMPVLGLESADDQIRLLAEMESDTQAEMLRSTLLDLPQLGAQFEQAFDLWRSGDHEGLNQLLLVPMQAEYPRLFSRVFKERNNHMLASIQRLAEQPARYFVVVGAGHLIGRFGLIELLSQAGVAVEQL